VNASCESKPQSNATAQEVLHAYRDGRHHADQQQALRQRWEKFKSLPPNEQSAVRQNFHRFQQLPPQRRNELRERWHNASPAQRQQMLQQSRERRMQRMPIRPMPRPGMRPPPRQR